MVLRRIPAWWMIVLVRKGLNLRLHNLTSVVDDAFVGVEQIVRGDDLLGASPVVFGAALGLTQPALREMPLALNEGGQAPGEA